MTVGGRVLYLPPWRIDVVTRDGVRSPLAAARIARAVRAVLEAAGAPAPGSVTVVLTDDGELEDLNVTHMGHAGPTDVLSFPMLEPEAFHRAGPDDARPRARAMRASPRARPRTHIGDIAISVERAAAQARDGRGGQTGDVRWSAADELRLLVTHGTLHLCGWDHTEPGEEASMRAFEQALLARQHRGVSPSRVPFIIADQDLDIVGVGFPRPSRRPRPPHGGSGPARCAFARDRPPSG